MTAGTLTTADTLALYAEAVWSAVDLIEVRAFPQKRQNGHAAPVSLWLPAETLHTKTEKLVALNKSGLNITAGVLPRREEGGKTDEDTLAGWALWADLDDIEPRAAWMKAKSVGLPRPSVVVNSGHGAHLYWRLKAAIEPMALSEAVADLAALLESDSSVKNPSRILRLPGFSNLKEPVAPVELLYAKPELQYEWDEIRAMIPRTAAEIARQVVSVNGGISTYQGGEREALIGRARRYVATIEGAAPGGRTTKAFKVAAALQNDFGLSEAEALPILAGWDSAANNPSIQSDPQYGFDELASIMKNAAKHAKGTPGRLVDSNRASPRTNAPRRLARPSATNGTTELKEIFQAEGRGERRTVSLPWPRLSDGTAALRPGSVTVVAAPAGFGKSLFCLQLAVHAFRAEAAPFAFMPLEDSKADFMRRLLAHLSGTWSAIKDDQDTAQERLMLLDQYRKELDDLSPFIYENPRKATIGPDGKPTVPPLSHHDALEWVSDAAEETGARLLVIDPIAQIDFGQPQEWRGQAEFMRSLTGTAAHLKCSILLAAHLAKRAGQAGRIPPTADDIQGAAEIVRLSHTVLLIDRHEEKESEVCRPAGLRETVAHEYTIRIDKARNSDGRGRCFAFCLDSPRFREIGTIVPQRAKSKTTR